MKRFFLSGLLLLVIQFYATASSDSRIKNIRLFPWGAEVTRTASATVDAGPGEVVFTNLPADIDPASVQLKASGNFTILSVNSRTNHLQSPQLTREHQVLRDSLAYYRQEIDRKQALLKVYEEEESLLLANKRPGGSETGFTMGDLRSLADFFRQRLTEVKNLQLDTRADIARLQERHNRINNQLGRIHARQNTPVGEIVVTTTATRRVNGEFEFSYITYRAGWNVLYDVRVNDTGQPVDLLMKAAVFQNSGEDWENVQLVLSTASPHTGRTLPSLSTWFLRFVEPVVHAPRRHQPYAEGMMRSEMAAPVYILDMEDTAVAGSLAEVVQVDETRTTREYSIATPFTLRSGSDKRILEVQKSEVPASFTYYAAPRIDTDVYLVARLTEWEEFIIMPGEAGIFFENSWVGETFIDPGIVRDTLELSLGTDRGVRIERNRMADHSGRSLLGRRTTETVAWEILVRNNKNRTIEIEVRDQIPVSGHGDIQVNLEERSGAAFNEQTGMLVWKLTLAPGESSTLPFRYTVRYPSDKIIRLE